MRSYMRAKLTGDRFDEERLARVGLTARQTEQMYRLLAIAKYDDRFVIPTSHKEGHMNPYRAQGSAGFGDVMGNMGTGMDGGCSGCSAVDSFSPGRDKDGKTIYEENFYGGIWRD